MKYLTDDKAINLLADCLNLKLSNEQLEIMQAELHHPLLINSIAGSGKTTTFMLRNLYLILTGRMQPASILGITFSKKAQTDMLSKYNKMVKTIKKNKAVKENDTLQKVFNQHPSFSTFHSLFYGLLRACKLHGTLNLIPNGSSIMLQMYKQIDDKNDQGTPQDIFGSIFQARENLINANYSNDGLDLVTDMENIHKKRKATSMKKFLIMHDNLAKFHPNFAMGTERAKNYYRVVKTYNNYKKQHGYIDFNDMKTLLLKDLNNPKYAKMYKQKMGNVEYVVLDEFQDIDSIQWEIIAKILPKKTLTCLTGIGDDDQSIYSFRGSNPQYILHYNEYMKDLIHKSSRTKTLSTNYRTGGNILRSVVPMIEKNKQRMSKSIYPYKPNLEHGNIFISDNINAYTKRIINDINDDSLKKNDVVVLTRYNDSRMILSDALANYGYYTDFHNRKLILQNNRYYSALMGCLKAFVLDDATPMREIAKYIGFSKYSNMVEKAAKEKPDMFSDTHQFFINMNNYLISQSDYKITSLNKDTNKIYENIQLMMKKLDELDQLIKDENKAHPDVISEKIQRLVNRRKSILTIIMSQIKDAINPYFKYMTKNNFISKNSIKDIDNYLEKNIIPYWYTVSDIQKFIQNDENKKRIMNNSKLIKTINANNNIKMNVSFLSIHQSKGLEFKHVYLYDSNDKEVSANIVKLSKYFKPQMTLNDFKRMIVNLNEDEVIALESIYMKESLSFSAYDELAVKLDLNGFKYVAFKPRFSKKDLGKHFIKNKRVSFLQKIAEYLQYTNNKYANKVDQTYEDSFELLYRQTLKAINMVEEERRLLYVAITRAKDNLYLDLPYKPIPILLELNLKDAQLLNDNDKFKVGKMLMDKWLKWSNGHIKVATRSLNISKPIIMKK